MPDRDSVIDGLDEITHYNCEQMFYNDIFIRGIAADAIDLLKEHQGTGCWEWIVEDKYRCSECQNITYVDECMEEPQYLYCPYCGSKMTFAGRN